MTGLAQIEGAVEVDDLWLNEAFTTGFAARTVHALRSHQATVTRVPNHWWACSWAMV